MYMYVIQQLLPLILQDSWLFSFVMNMLPRIEGCFILCNTVQDDLLAREIFGEFVSEIQLADFILVILL